MESATKPLAHEVLAGLVERVTYHNVENGFCVLRAKVRGHRDMVTIVGHAATIAAGVQLGVTDYFDNDDAFELARKAWDLLVETREQVKGSSDEK